MRSDFDFLRDFSFSKLGMQLSPNVQNHVFKVYSNLFQMLVLTTAAVWLQMTSNSYIVETLCYFGWAGGLICLAGFYWTDELQNETRAKLFMLGFGAFKGFALAPLISLAISINPSLVPAAFGSTAVVFGSLSAAVLYSPIPSYFYLSGLILSTMGISFWLTILNIFLRSPAIFTLELYLGLFCFSLYVMYDTQVLVKKAEEGSKLYLRHCLDLYVDAVAIFIRILAILLKKDDDKKEKRKNKQ